MRSAFQGPGRRPPVILLAFVLAAAGCGGEPVASPPRPNILLITLDTLRADHLPCYGHPRDTAPSICALAEAGTLFRRAVSQASWTLPAHASIMTGLYPHQHGAVQWQSRMRDDQPVLAEILAEQGYRTAAVVSTVYVGARYGFARGFEEFVDLHRPPGERAVFAKWINDAAMRWIDGVADDGEQPFFAWLHYYDPHHAFLFHEGEPLSERASAEAREIDYEGWDTLRPPAMPRFAANRDDLMALYEGEIRVMDSEIGRMIEYLDERGLSDDTVVIVTSDHGESFGKHGLFGHDHYLYDNLLRVPRIVYVPGGEPLVRDDWVETRWIFHAVHELLGLETDGSGPKGPSLLRPGRQRSGQGMALAENQNRNPDRRVAITQDRWKLIYTLGIDDFELYDLEADPGERNNVVRDHPDVAGTLRDELFARMGVVHLEEDAMRHLRSLGYVD